MSPKLESIGKVVRIIYAFEEYTHTIDYHIPSLGLDCYYSVNVLRPTNNASHIETEHPMCQGSPIAISSPLVTWLIALPWMLLHSSGVRRKPLAWT